MTWQRKLRFWIDALVRKRRVDAEMDQEMRSHIEMQTEENIQAGMGPREARRASVREFGYLTTSARSFVGSSFDGSSISIRRSAV
jgi:hypothetical protein